MFFRRTTPSSIFSDLILTALFMIISASPLLAGAATTEGFNHAAGQDVFTVPKQVSKKAVTGIDQGKYDLVVDSKTINHSLTTGKGIIDINVEFASGSAKLTKTASLQLKQISIALKQENLKNREIMIIGHTDNVGKAAVNQQLSEMRALQVKKALIESGIDKNRLESSGRGESEPVSDNKSAAGRARNRRVTLVLKTHP